MPRGFSEDEKQQIHTQLLEKGRVLFEQYGLKKTNVEELTRAVGISKGAFYLFYNSKEELFFEIVDRVQDEFRQKVFAQAVENSASARESFKQFLRVLFRELEHYPLLYAVGKEEYETLLRKLPREIAEEHLGRDAQVMEQFLEYFKNKGRFREVDGQVFANLGVSLYLLWMHREDMIFTRFEETLDIWIELLANYLVLEEGVPQVN
jgi:AcrR family transcriptional regulator